MDSCQEFSEGFVVGAEIDQAWLDDEEAWRLVAPLAYLCDHRDLVPDAQRENFDANPDAKALICREMSEILGAMRRSHPFFEQPLVGSPVAGRTLPSSP